MMEGMMAGMAANMGVIAIQATKAELLISLAEYRHFFGGTNCPPVAQVVQVLNEIPLVYAGVEPVMDAYDVLVDAPNQRREAYVAMLGAMAEDLGLEAPVITAQQAFSITCE